MDKIQYVPVSSGIGLGGLLGLLFVGLKLGNVITWSWWFVTMPFWIGPALVLGILALFLVVFLIVLMVALVFGK